MSTDNESYLQPIRIPSGWEVTYNTFPDLDPTEETINEFQGSSLLMLLHPSANRLVDVFWKPELDINGSFKMEVYNRLEVFNPKNNSFDSEVDWENPYLVFETKNRARLIQKLEKTLLEIPVYVDQRILKNRGVVDEPAEKLRKKLNENSLTFKLSEEIINAANSKLQDMLLDHPEVSREIVEKLAEKGITKGLKRKATQKLNSKKFKSFE